MFNQEVQDELKIFQDTTNKKTCEHRETSNELREDFNKYQSKTKDTIKEEVYEIKKATQDIKE
jgi:hypothetical protein